MFFSIFILKKLFLTKLFFLNKSNTLVSVFDLLLGTKKEITTVDGKKLSITIPKGCQPGTVLSISEQGLPRLHGRGKGNIYMTVQADIPNISDPEMLKLLQRIKYGTN